MKHLWNAFQVMFVFSMFFWENCPNPLLQFACMHVLMAAPTVFLKTRVSSAWPKSSEQLSHSPKMMRFEVESSDSAAESLQLESKRLDVAPCSMRFLPLPF